MKRRVGKQTGFTLIELLIVVAIIGILAAIAIPNFLQAQVRAKVSRTQSDMRSTAMGIELYHTDTGSYPMDAQYYTVIPALASFLPRLARLTTPVDYITTVPEDVFAVGAVGGGSIWDGAYRVPFSSGPLVRPYTFDYANRIMPDGSRESRVIWGRITSHPDTVIWALRSIGPDHVATYLGYATDLYDPTNGTVSNGEIFYTGPGMGLDKPM